MACCSPFSAAIDAQPGDPTRHVNFVTGMVLGVDDYAQEFAYHSARDKWIVREFLGYGTLSGLDVAVEADGADGPRVRVTAGSAAAPSGQLICVGREQCGSLNAWLARKDVAEEVRKLTDPSAATSAILNLFLTLCYFDCPVAEVPIPGEPCRSDENLMAPSRIADDYCLEIRFEPPPMAEARAVEALTAIFASIDTSGAPADDAPTLAAAVRRAEIQLRAALGVADSEDFVPAAGDLDPVKLHQAALGRFGAALKRAWITRIRPHVAAQACGTASVAADDCVLLARLGVPIVKVDSHWEVTDAAAVALDETARPLLLSAAVAQSPVGATLGSDPRGQKIAFMTASGNIPGAATLVVIRSAAAVNAKLPKAATAGAGRQITVKSADVGETTLTTVASDKVEGADTFVLAKRGAATLVSDGDKGWHVIGLVK
ncbi:MAG TPA: hypothetical protein VE053_08215 [Allosphingosinicella sp.]|nr:hypothetical protein [Allosphingosinicella sp.]